MKNKSLLILLFCSTIIFGQQVDKDGIYLNVEKMPAIKGGFSTVGEKIIYPKIAIKIRMQSVNGTIGYYNVAPIVEKTFNIMGITNYSKIYNSEEEAIKALT